jgi:hypothetical protein
MLVPGESHNADSSSSDDERVMQTLRAGGAEAAVELDEVADETVGVANLSGGRRGVASGQGLASQLSFTLGSVTEAVGRQWTSLSRQVWTPLMRRGAYMYLTVLAFFASLGHAGRLDAWSKIANIGRNWHQRVLSAVIAPSEVGRDPRASYGDQRRGHGARLRHVVAVGIGCGVETFSRSGA